MSGWAGFWICLGLFACGALIQDGLVRIASAMWESKTEGRTDA